VTPRRIGLLVAIVFVIAAVGVGVWIHLRSRAAQAADVAAASLHQCLLGPTLEEGESAGARIRRIALGNPPLDWPKRCDQLATELASALDRAGRASEAADIRAKWGDGFDLASMEASPWDVALPAVPAGTMAAAGVPSAPPPAEVADERMAVLLPKATLGKPSSNAVPARQLDVIVSGGQWCSFSKSFDSAKCTSVAKRAPAGAQAFQLWPPTDDGAPPWVTDFVHPGGRVQRFFRADTGMLVDTQSPSRAVQAHGYADGSVVTFGPAGGAEAGYELVLFKGREHGDPFRIDLDARQVALFGELLLWVTRADDDLYHLMSARLTREPLALGKPQDHGELDVMPTFFEACRTQDALAVALVRGADARVMFFSDSEVSKPHWAKLKADANVTSRVLACGADDLTITRVVTRSRRRSDTDAIGFIVQHARCTQSGCDTHELDLDEMFDGAVDALRPSGVKDTEVVAGGMAGKLLVAWRSESRGVRARIAAPGELAKATDTVLYDDGLQEGRTVPGGTVMKMALFPRYDAAALLLELAAERGIAALRIGVDGKVTPVVAK